MDDTRILVVEDDADINEVVRAVGTDGYACVRATGVGGAAEGMPAGRSPRAASVRRPPTAGIRCFSGDRR